jgi:2-haloacid dehalogenase
MLLHYSTVSNSINEYHNLQLSPLQPGYGGHLLKVTNEEIKDTLSVIKSLQTYPDVIKGLQLLKEMVSLSTLTNSPDAALQEQLKNSKLTHYFEQALSIDTIESTNQQGNYLWAATS